MFVAARRAGRLAAAALVLSPIALASSANAAPSAQGLRHRAVCPGAPAGFAHCDSQVVTDASGAPAATATPAGYGPADLQSAYKLPSATAGSGKTIAIVDAFDDPNAESDLGVYRAQYGLPACTTTNGCFKKVNQTGVQGSYPHTDAGWSQEISLDVDMASAVCPNCKILLVEAKTSAFANLSTAVDTAARLGASTISNSYGGSEYAGEVADQGHYNHPGIAVTVSSGDSGYGVEFPAASQYVTAVGGTALTRASTTTRGWAESAWSGAGSGCSAYVAKPSWQTDTGCARRTVADVSAVADPNTGVAVYDSLRGSAGWMIFGGTSVAAPVIAGVYALAGNPVASGSFPYANSSSLFDVTSGSNGTCSVAYLCTAGTGFDGPTGLGTPNGVGAF